MPKTQYFRARHVATMTAAGVIDDGCVVVEDGRIADVGPTRDLHPPRIDHDVDGLLTPGLVNAHTHLELTDVPRPLSPGTFQNWLLTTMAATHEVDEDTVARRRADAVRQGVAQSLRFGVTAVGDVTQNPAVVRPVLGTSPLRAISYGECLGLGPRRARYGALLRAAVDWNAVTPRMMIGVSPHAPYTVDGDGYAASDVARTQVLDSFWCTHIAETADEAAFIADRTGPFAELYRTLGFDPGRGDGFHGSPIQWLYQHLNGSAGDLLVHVNYCTNDDIGLIAARRAVVAWCPRTHDYFGHPPHRWRDMLARGIPVCVATDSCASSPDLNVMDDLRRVRRQSPDVEPSVLWRMVTADAARAFLWPALTPMGTIEPSGFADLVAWPTRSSDPLAEVLDTAGMLPCGVWIDGSVPSPVVLNGRGLG